MSHKLAQIQHNTVVYVQLIMLLLIFCNVIHIKFYRYIS